MLIIPLILFVGITCFLCVKLKREKQISKKGSEQHLWRPDFDKNWKEIEINAYDIIISQAEKCKTEAISETESITNKSIRTLMVIGAMAAFFVAQTPSLPLASLVTSWTTISVVIIFLFDLILLFILVFPRNLRGDGYEPKDFATDHLDEPEDMGFQAKILSYRVILFLQHDITMFRPPK